VLSDEERDRILAAREAAEDPRAACLEALWIVQERRGWVSDEIEGIAHLLGMSAEEVDALATFYSLVFRRPVGKHVIFLCDSVACHVTGAAAVAARLRERLGVAPGETTADEQFTLLPVACLGACGEGPALMIDGAVHGDLTPERVDRILEEYGA